MFFDFTKKRKQIVCFNLIKVSTNCRIIAQEKRDETVERREPISSVGVRGRLTLGESSQQAILPEMQFSRVRDQLKRALWLAILRE